MRQFWRVRASTGASLVLLFLCAAGCTGSLYNWQVRTIATPVAPSFDQAPLEAKPVAILPALSMPALRGTEVGIVLHFCPNPQDADPEHGQWWASKRPSRVSISMD